MDWSDPMKKAFKIIVPLVLSAAILLSIGWYLFVYDRSFTRDILLQQARYCDMAGHVDLASWFYDLAYEYTGQDENIAIELANQYKADGNYTKAEVTLTDAITNAPTAELYAALCKTFVEQDKLMNLFCTRAYFQAFRQCLHNHCQQTLFRLRGLLKE